MTPRIGPKKPVHVYLAAWRTYFNLTQQQVADRIGTSKGTVSRWETSRRVPSANVLAAYAEALDLHVGDLYRRPALGRSLDAMIADVAPDVRQKAVELINLLSRRA